MNVGFRVAMAEFPWECVVFHDVDHLPEDVRNVYRCPEQVSGDKGLCTYY